MFLKNTRLVAIIYKESHIIENSNKIYKKIPKPSNKEVTVS